MDEGEGSVGSSNGASGKALPAKVGQRDRIRVVLRVRPLSQFERQVTRESVAVAGDEVCLRMLDGGCIASRSTASCLKVPLRKMSLRIRQVLRREIFFGLSLCHRGLWADGLGKTFTMSG